MLQCKQMHLLVYRLLSVAVYMQAACMYNIPEIEQEKKSSKPAMVGKSSCCG